MLSANWGGGAHFCVNQQGHYCQQLLVVILLLCINIFNTQELSVFDMSSCLHILAEFYNILIKTGVFEIS